MVWYSHLVQNFPKFIVIHTVKSFGIVNKAEIDVFLELSCFFHDPADVGNLISGSSVFSKTSLNIRKFTVHILLKPESSYLTLNMILFLLCHITSLMVMRDRELHAKRTASTNHLNLERKHEYMLSSTGEERLKIAGSCEIAQGRGHRAMRVRVRSLQWEVTHLVREGKRNDFICVFKRSL